MLVEKYVLTSGRHPAFQIFNISQWVENGQKTLERVYTPACTYSPIE
jgi:hypothetical protein